MSLQVEYRLVILSGDATVSDIDKTYVQLRDALSEEGPVLLDIDAVTETDLTFVQLIEAARCKASEAGVGLMLRHPAKGALLEMLGRGGFLDDDRSDRARFWLQGADQ